MNRKKEYTYKYIHTQQSNRMNNNKRDEQKRDEFE
jgi:hypothetical protein